MCMSHTAVGDPVGITSTNVPYRYPRWACIQRTALQPKTPNQPLIALQRMDMGQEDPAPRQGLLRAGLHSPKYRSTLG